MFESKRKTWFKMQLVSFLLVLVLLSVGEYALKLLKLTQVRPDIFAYPALPDIQSLLVKQQFC